MSDRIKPEELRIGNLILYRNEAVPVSGITQNGSIIVRSTFNRWKFRWPSPNQVSGVPLSKDWLERFGFECKHDPVKKHDVMWRHPEDDPEETAELLHCCNFHWQDEKFIFIELHNDHGEYATFPISHLKYVHQLQNLFYSLTSTELQLKEQTV